MHANCTPKNGEGDSYARSFTGRYLETGFHFVRIPKQNGKPSKAPTLSGWNLPQAPDNPHGYTNSLETAAAWLQAGDNIGLALVPSGVVSLDIDNLEETRRVFTGVGVDLGAWFADPHRVEIRSGKPGKAKLLFRVPSGVMPPSRKLNFGTGKTARSIFEIRHGSADGRTVQDVLPPSIHPDTGKPYEWVGDIGRIPGLPPELLALWQTWPEILKTFDPAYEPPKQATRPQQARQAIEGQRDPVAEFNQAHSLESLLESHGYRRKGRRWLRPGSESGIPGVTLLEGGFCYSHGGDALNDGHKHDAFDLYRILDCGGDWKTALAWSEAITAHNRRLFRERPTAAQGENPKTAAWGTANTAERDWGDPKPIRAELYPVPAFDPDTLLPAVLSEWVMDEADRMPASPDFIAAALIVALGSVIGARCAVKPKARDDWQIVPNLWGGVVGPPSVKKSPAIGSGMKPLDRLIAKAMKAHQAELEQYEIEATIHKAHQEALQGKIKSKAKTANPSGGMNEVAAEWKKLRDNAPKPPTMRRYKSNDTTVEKLGELLRENPTGLLVLRDELVGLIASWEREGREGERAFYLEAWNGNASFDTDRIGRGSIFIENLCVSIFGGIQPDKLIGYLEQAANALANDGMLQRFQVLVYPDLRPWEWRDRIPNQPAREAAHRVFEALAEFDPVAWGASPANDFAKFPCFQFGDRAQEVFIEWSTELHRDKLPAEDHPIVAQHLAKFDKLFPALALILHLVDCAATGQRGPITEPAALRAAAWCDYLEAHARRCYGLLADDGLRAAQALAEKVQQGKLADGFTAREVRRNQWRYLTTDEAVNAALDWLEDEGWLRSIDSGGTGPGTGRRTSRYFINPAVMGQVL